MDVSKNRGTPKSSIGVFHYKSSILGYPCFWKHLRITCDNLSSQALNLYWQRCQRGGVAGGEGWRQLGGTPNPCWNTPPETNMDTNGYPKWIKMMVWKRWLLSNMGIFGRWTPFFKGGSIFRFHVSFWECSCVMFYTIERWLMFCRSFVSKEGCVSCRFRPHHRTTPTPKDLINRLPRMIGWILKVPCSVSISCDIIFLFLWNTNIHENGRFFSGG